MKGAYGGITPASVVNGALYVSNCPAFALRAESGATIWTDSTSPFFNGYTVNLGTMQVIGATAYAACTDGTVRALNAAAGWWWADPLSALIILGYGLREARHAWAEAS